MQPIAFIQGLLTEIKFSNARVLEMLQSFTNNNTDETLRILAYISGYAQKPEIPEHSEKINKEDATLIEYDFFRNTLEFRYLETRTYKVSEEFKHLDGEVFDSCYSIPREVRNNTGEFPITVKFKDTSRCSLNEWC